MPGGSEEAWPHIKNILQSISAKSDLLKFDDVDGKPPAEKLVDTAGQKGTGKWTAINALDVGMPVTLIGEAVFARCLTAVKNAELEPPRSYSGPEVPKRRRQGQKQFVDDLEQALYASRDYFLRSRFHVDPGSCCYLWLETKQPCHRFDVGEAAIIRFVFSWVKWLKNQI
nr:CIH_HP1_G0025270.mRNA.1.CDS.1 [Saccharomyces cerevisiae]